MNNPGRKWLAVDSDVLLTAFGENSQRGLAARRILFSILEICHRVVFCEDAWRETKSFGNGDFLLWRHQMHSKKKLWHTGLSFGRPEHLSALADFKKVQRRIADTRAAVEECLDKLAVAGDLRKSVLKDFHLIESAMLGDGIVVSFDKPAYGRFLVVGKQVNPVGATVWFVPYPGSDSARHFDAFLMDADAPLEHVRLQSIPLNEEAKSFLKSVPNPPKPRKGARKR